MISGVAFVLTLLGATTVIWFLLAILAMRSFDLFQSAAERAFLEEYRKRTPLDGRELFDGVVDASGFDSRIIARVMEIVGTNYNLDPRRIRLDDRWEVIDDSLDFAEIAYEMERAFNIKLDLGEFINTCQTVRGTVELVQDKLIQRYGKVVLSPERTPIDALGGESNTIERTVAADRNPS
jgi:acyl carrier protein